MTKVKIDTAKGVMIAELYDNETPITVDNFKKLISEGFYN
jgi:cyclophilin family peptidyl-prolyl cis-trans isomerase